MTKKEEKQVTVSQSELDFWINKDKLIRNCIFSEQKAVFVLAFLSFRGFF